MPTYGYECTACNEQFEVFQKMTDAPLAIHDGCGGELRRLLYPVGIVFKGPGFHVNDYSRSGKTSKPESASDSKPDAKANTKAEPTKSSTASTAESPSPH